MSFCISIGSFNTKYFIYCVFIAILELYINFGIKKINEEILNDYQIFDTFCYYFGYLLNIIPTWFVKDNYYNNPDNKHLSAKDIIKLFSICFILFLIQFYEIVFNAGINIDNDNENKQSVGYEDNFILDLIIIMFIELRFFFKNIVVYMHQKISFLTFFIIEIIKTIYFFNINENNNKKNGFWTIIIGFFYSLLLSIYYIYIDGLMKHKYISPYKCSFMIGACFVPLLIIGYFIILFVCINGSKYSFDVFKSFGKLEAINIIVLISYPFASGAL